MFGLNFGKCKRSLQHTISACFDPLKGEIGNVPPELNKSRFITASMLGICEGLADSYAIKKPQSVALIVDAVFEEVFRADATDVLRQVDDWKNNADQEFMEAYQQAKARTCADGKQLNLDWLQKYAVDNFERSNTLML